MYRPKSPTNLPKPTNISPSHRNRRKNALGMQSNLEEVLSKNKSKLHNYIQDVKAEKKVLQKR